MPLFPYVAPVLPTMTGDTIVLPYGAFRPSHPPAPSSPESGRTLQVSQEWSAGAGCIHSGIHAKPSDPYPAHMFLPFYMMVLNKTQNAYRSTQDKVNGRNQGLTYGGDPPLRFQILNQTPHQWTKRAMRHHPIHLFRTEPSDIYNRFSAGRIEIHHTLQCAKLVDI